jgi:hypothetical protein
MVFGILSVGKKGSLLPQVPADKRKCQGADGWAAATGVFFKKIFQQ